MKLDLSVMKPGQDDTDIQSLAFARVPGRCVLFPKLFIDPILTWELFLLSTTDLLHQAEDLSSQIYSLAYGNTQESP